jgi:hypothetical protein
MKLSVDPIVSIICTLFTVTNLKCAAANRAPSAALKCSSGRSDGQCLAVVNLASSFGCIEIHLYRSSLAVINLALQ